jgi:hypothetical protein
MNNPRELQLDPLGYGIPLGPQKPLQSGDKRTERKALAPSQPQPNHQEIDIMENQTHQTAPSTAPVPGVPQKKGSAPIGERAKSFGTTALTATREHAVTPLVEGFFAGAGVLVAYKTGKKLGWL